MFALIVDSGKHISIDELAGAVLELTGSGVGVTHDVGRVGDIHHSYATIAKAKRLLTYQPTIKLRQGLELIIKSGKK